MLKILFCGLGSIGTRHLKNLRAVLTERGIDFTVDAVRSSLREISPEIAPFIKDSYLLYGDVPDDYDVAFVTNPTSLHFDTVSSLSKKAKNMFIEKPVFSEVPDDLSGLGLKAGVKYVACPLRHTPLARELKGIAGQKTVSAVRAICSSYLPEWRKGVDYRDNYSAKKELGGGVRLDLIHEWDYLTYIFGMPSAVASLSGHLSPLEITSEDLAVYIARYPDKLLSLHIDYIGRKSRREVELFCEDDVLTGDFVNGTIKSLVTGKVTELPREDFYVNEMNYFIDCVLSGTRDNMNTVEHAADVLRLALSR